MTPTTDTMNDTLCIETNALTKVYGSGNTEVVAMRDATMSVRKGEVVALSKRQSFRLISTRKYYPGLHAIEILVNGKAYSRVEFELL